MSNVDRLRHELSQQLGIVQALESDLNSPERLDGEIQRLRDEADRFYERANQLESRKGELQTAYDAAKRRERELRNQLQTELDPRRKKLARMAAELAALTAELAAEEGE